MALQLGWGDWKDYEAWDEAAVTLLKKLHARGYQSKLDSGWLLETDINKLFDNNPHYLAYKAWTESHVDAVNSDEYDNEEHMKENEKF